MVCISTRAKYTSWQCLELKTSVTHQNLVTHYFASMLQVITCAHIELCYIYFITSRYYYVHNPTLLLMGFANVEDGPASSFFFFKATN